MYCLCYFAGLWDLICSDCFVLCKNFESLCFSFETIYAPNGFDFRQEVTIEEDDEDLPPLGPPLMAKILDSACGQSTQEVKLKHRRARCPAFYMLGDTTKLGQPNDQGTNRIVCNFLRKGSAR